VSRDDGKHKLHINFSLNQSQPPDHNT